MLANCFPLLLMLPRDKFIEPQFFVVPYMAATSEERKVERFPAGMMLEVFELSVLSGYSHNRRVFMGTLTTAFHSKSRPQDRGRLPSTGTRSRSMLITTHLIQSIG